MRRDIVNEFECIFLICEGCVFKLKCDIKSHLFLSLHLHGMVTKIILTLNTAMAHFLHHTDTESITVLQPKVPHSPHTACILLPSAVGQLLTPSFREECGNVLLAQHVVQGQIFQD